MRQCCFLKKKKGVLRNYAAGQTDASIKSLISLSKVHQSRLEIFISMCSCICTMYIQTLAEKLIISLSKVHQSRLENCVCICNCICNCCTYRHWLDFYLYLYRLTGFVFVFTDWLDTGYWSNFKRFVASS